MLKLISALFACIILLTNSITLAETKDIVENDKYMLDPEPTSLTHISAKSRLRMTPFLNFIGVAGEINYRGINDAASVKGSLTDAFGNALANKEILIYVNHNLMGKVRTDSEGCFYFNSWNNTALKPIIDKRGDSGVYWIKVWAIFPGDHEYKRSFTYKKDVIYLHMPLLPVPNNYIPTTKAEVNAGSSVDVPVVVQLNPGQEMLNLKLSLDALPCRGVSAFIGPSVIPKLEPKLSETGNVIESIYNETSKSIVTKKYETVAGKATIHISIDSNLKSGKYTFVIVGEGIIKDLRAGDERHAKEWFGLLHLTVSR